MSMDHQPRDDSLDRHKCDQSVILDKKKVWCGAVCLVMRQAEQDNGKVELLLATSKP